MKLLAQGKTNWRYILIAGVLVAIICGTIWLFFSSYRKMAPTKVSPDFMCSKNVAIAGYVGSGDYDKILPPGIKYVICSDELTSLGIKFLQPLREDTRAIPSCVPLETSQEFSIDGSKPISEGPEITINGTVQCIDNRKIKNPDCELSSLGCQLVMWLKESAPEKETADWKTYRNEEYGIAFAYPQELGDMTLRSQKNNEFYVFDSDNEGIKILIHHSLSGNTAVVIKGEKYELEFNGENYQETLKIINPNKEIKTIYTISPEMTKFYGHISKNINFSPDGEYVCFVEAGYEWSSPKIFNIDSNINILKGYDIWFNDVYEDIFWSQDNKALAIRSHTNYLTGGGISGLFVSDYGRPEGLNEAFSFSAEEDLRGPEIKDIIFLDDDKLSFSVELYGGNIKKYVYFVKTKELIITDSF